MYPSSFVAPAAFLAGLAGLVAVSPARGQQAADGLAADCRILTTERLQEGEQIVLDGLLDTMVWSWAVPATDFIQQDLLFDGSPTERCIALAIEECGRRRYCK